MIINKKHLLIIPFVFISYFTFSQGDLSKKINIDVKDESFENILLNVADQASLSLSYNPKILPVDSVFSLRVENSSVNQVLKVLLGEELELKLSGNHLVILNSKYYSGKSNRQKQKITIDGFIKDKQGNSVNNATVFSVNNLESTQTDQSGYFSLEVSLKDEFMGLSIIQPEFEDETIVIESKTQEVSIELATLSSLTASISPSTPGSGVDDLKIVKTLANKPGLSVRGNLDTYLSIPLQVSFLPFLGTNLLMSGLVENRLSYNIIGGFNGAVRGIEFGGVLNITRHYMHGVQFGGVWNIVGKEVRGVQFGGVLNTNLGDVTGVNMAGVGNFSLGSFNGLQFSGILNSSVGEITGLQLAGIINYAHRGFTKGGQISGLTNFVFKGSSDFQISGLFNYSTNIRRTQIAGITNITKDTLSGVQISPINFTGRNKGVQVGLINIAHADKGISMGILNIIMGGYNKIELSYGLLNQKEVKIKMGTAKFYNIFGHTFLPNNKPNIIYGFGTLFGKKEKSPWNIDLTHTSFEENNYFSNTELVIGKSYNITKWLGLYGGLNFNYQRKKIGAVSGVDYENMYLLSIKEIPGTNFNSRIWSGLEAGIRIF